MASSQQHAPSTSIDPGTEVSHLTLSVADLDRSVDFYNDAIGLDVLERSGSQSTLGVAGTPLLTLEEQPGATAWPRGGRSYTGLYHFAILVPTRADLGRWLAHWLERGLPFPGQGDHLVSEALYLEDPDGHGIEIYRDRPRSEWKWENNQVRMAVDPVDIRGILADGQQSGDAWQGMSEGTRIGHIHLQVGNIDQAVRFYHEVLGFDVVARMPGALFVSAGGYHHHIGMNTWHSQGGGHAPDDSVTLRQFTIDLPSTEALQDVLARIESAELPHSGVNSASVIIQDPWENTIVLRVTDPQVAATPDLAVSAPPR